MIGWIEKTYDYFLYVASTLPLRSTRVRRQYSPLVAMHHMILCVRRKFFEITTKPNRLVRREEEESEKEKEKNER